MKPPAPAAAAARDPLTTALHSMLAELVREAVSDALAEHAANEAPAPALLTAEGLCSALQTSRATE